MAKGAWPAGVPLSGGPALLRPFADEDAQARCDFYVRNRSYFREHSGIEADKFYTPDGQRAIIRSQHADQAAGDGWYWGIFRGPGEHVIGVVSLTGIVRGPFQAAWIGYSIDEAHTGRGLATHAVQAVTAHAFRDLGLHRVEAGVMPSNAASIRVLEKAGFAREGLMRQTVLINGRWEDHWHYAAVSDTP